MACSLCLMGLEQAHWNSVRYQGTQRLCLFDGVMRNVYEYGNLCQTLTLLALCRVGTDQSVNKPFGK